MEPSDIVVKFEAVQPLKLTVWQFLKKLKKFTI